MIKNLKIHYLNYSRAVDSTWASKTHQLSIWYYDTNCNDKIYFLKFQYIRVLSTIWHIFFYCDTLRSQDTWLFIITSLYDALASHVRPPTLPSIACYILPVAVLSKCSLALHVSTHHPWRKQSVRSISHDNIEAQNFSNRRLACQFCKSRRL